MTADAQGKPAAITPGSTVENGIPNKALTSAGAPTTWTQLLRIFSWATVFLMGAFLINNYLTNWLGWPGGGSILTYLGLTTGKPNPDAASLGLLQFVLYALAIVVPVLMVKQRGTISLRQDSQALSSIAAYIIRAAFWMVLLVGIADAAISFLRVEGFLADVVGTDTAKQMARSRFRGPYIHFPLIALSLLLALVFRGLNFIWLALLVVLAEFAIVITRFIFSYEQAFMGDLVRFWYAALFLFASAYTLIEEGHVRVDVLYASFAQKTRGWVNLFGSVFLGMSLCWVILITGMAGKSDAINGPLLSLEVSQSGFGMYVKYLMAGFLGIFATSMLVQFASYALDAAADIRGDPGGRNPDSDAMPH